MRVSSRVLVEMKPLGLSLVHVNNRWLGQVDSLSQAVVFLKATIAPTVGMAHEIPVPRAWNVARPSRIKITYIRLL